jgi:hypothetical protein
MARLVVGSAHNNRLDRSRAGEFHMVRSYLLSARGSTRGSVTRSLCAEQSGRGDSTPRQTTPALQPGIDLA